MTDERTPRFFTVSEVINFIYKLCMNSENDRMVRRRVLELLFVNDTYWYHGFWACKQNTTIAKIRE
jgi:hypothetical protein